MSAAFETRPTAHHLVVCTLHGLGGAVAAVPPTWLVLALLAIVVGEGYISAERYPQVWRNVTLEARGSVAVDADAASTVVGMD